MTKEPINIRAKDLMRINGLSQSQCYKILRKIRLSFGKQKHQFVTIEETSEYLGVDESNILERLGFSMENSRKTPKKLPVNEKC